jgi:hypothetical protein
MRRPLALAAGASIAVAVLTYAANPASAGPGDREARGQAQVKDNTATGAIFLSASNEPMVSAPLAKKPDGSTSTWICRFYVGVGTSSSPFYTTPDGVEHHVNEPVTPQKGGGYQLYCKDEAGNDVYYNPAVLYNPDDPGSMLGQNGDLARLIQAAYTQLRAPVPAVVTSPPRDQRQIVGVKTWFWLRDWAEISAPPADAAGFRVIVKGVPTQLVIDPGDGSGPMRPCTPDNSPAWADGGPADTGCGHVYHQRSTATDPNGTFTVTATVTYTVAWQTADPAGNVTDGGPLAPPITGDGQFPITVHQVQAVGR